MHFAFFFFQFNCYTTVYGGYQFSEIQLFLTLTALFLDRQISKADLKNNNNLSSSKFIAYLVI